MPAAQSSSKGANTAYFDVNGLNSILGTATMPLRSSGIVRRSASDQPFQWADTLSKYSPSHPPVRTSLPARMFSR
jgi:hypothetical protein